MTQSPNHELSQFVMNEVIDPSSSDDENDQFFNVAHMIIEDSVNQRVELVLSRSMYWIIKDFYTMVFFIKTTSRITLRSKQKNLDGGSHVLYIFI